MIPSIIISVIISILISILISIERIPQQSQSGKCLDPTAAQRRKLQATVSLFFHQACFPLAFSVGYQTDKSEVESHSYCFL